jgi:hypothetical protein
LKREGGAVGVGVGEVSIVGGRWGGWWMREEEEEEGGVVRRVEGEIEG